MKYGVEISWLTLMMLLMVLGGKTVRAATYTNIVEPGDSNGAAKCDIGRTSIWDSSSGKCGTEVAPGTYAAFCSARTECSAGCTLEQC